MNHPRFHLTLLALLISSGTAFAAEPTTRPCSVTADVPTGIYRVGQPIVWSVDWHGGDAPPAATYTVLAGQVKSIASGAVQWAGNHAVVESKLDQPDTMLLKIDLPNDVKPALGGAIVAPEQINPADPKPDDFEAFWSAKLDELSKIPADPQLTSADSHKENVDYWQLMMNNIRGIHIRGQLARPHTGEKFPALLIVQWAGVYGLEPHWVTDRAAEGFLVLNISPHDIPIDQPADFYQDQFAGPLKDYWTIGNDDRDTSYFLHMYLSCYRAAEYLAQRPDWDGKTLVVMGGSQGGQQALLTAALCPQWITAAMADVPAGCDMLGPTVDRKGGWPQWYDCTWGGRNAAKVHEASRYYDIVHFAPRTRCPVLVGAGLIDQTCPAAGIAAATNQITSPKTVLFFPVGEHQDENHSHGAWDDAVWKTWLPRLAKGLPPPPPQ